MTWSTLIERAWQGDPDAFGRLWQTYLRPALLPYARGLTRNAHDAEDLLQDVVLHLFDQQRYRRIDRQDQAGVTSYVKQMVSRAFLDQQRERQQVRYVITPETITQLRQVRVAEAVLTRLAALRDLPPLERRAFLARIAEGVGPDLTEALQALLLQYGRRASARFQALPEHAAALPSEPPSVLEDLERADIMRLVADEVRGSVTEAEWRVFCQKHGDDDFSYRRYAAETGVAPSTLDSQYQRARAKVLAHPLLRRYWRGAVVTAADWRDLAYARELRFRLGRPRQAQVIAAFLLRKFRDASCPAEVLQFKAQTLDLLGGLAVLRNHRDEGVQYYQRAHGVWRTLRDAEQQATACLNIAVNCTTPGATAARRAWRYFHAAAAFLQSTLPNVHLLQGKYHRRLGYCYENAADYAAAEQALRQSAQHFEQAGVDVEVQVTQRQLGVIWLRRGQYDAAADLLTAMARAPALQSPVDQAKICGFLSELCFTVGQVDDALGHLTHATRLCEDYGLHLQRHVLRALAARYAL